MITIDRSDSRSVHDQLVEQLRFLIASGRYQVDDQLPSTRTLGKQVGVSFHTVRKAYQQLEEEGLLEARTGSGFRVRERAPLGKAERIERGAHVVQEALQKLIGLGLDEEELAYLFQEQFDQLATGPSHLKILFAGPFQEFADLCAEQLSLGLQQPVEGTSLTALDRHPDADFLITRVEDFQKARAVLPNIEHLGIVTYWQPEALEQVARMLPHETLGLITRQGDAVQPLMKMLRASTGFAGQTLALSIEERPRHIEQVVRQTNLIVYTPGCRRRLRSHLENHRQAVLLPRISPESLEHMRQTIPL